MADRHRSLAMGLYVRRGENVIGPIEQAKLKELAKDGRLLPTDQLAKDAAGPWTEASKTALFSKPVEPPPLPLAPRAETLPTPAVQDRPADASKVETALRTTKTVATAIGRGTLAVGSAISRALATRAARRHELKLAKIQAKAAAAAQNPQQPIATGPPAPAGPIMFAPQIVQTTVVKVINRNSGGCGCPGCSFILLLILLAILWAVYSMNTHSPPH